MKVHLFWIVLGICASIHHGSTQNTTNIAELNVTSSTLETIEEASTTTVMSTAVPSTTPEETTTTTVPTTTAPETIEETAVTTVPTTTTILTTSETVPTTNASTTTTALPNTTTTEIPTTTTVSTETTATAPVTAETTPTTTVSSTSSPSLNATEPTSSPADKNETMSTTSPDTTASTSTTAVFNETTTTSSPAPDTSASTSTTTTSTTAASSTPEADNSTTPSPATEPTTRTQEPSTSTEEDICAPCINGECEPEGAYECVCEDGWYGTNCDMQSVCEERSVIDDIATDCNETTPIENVTINFPQVEAGRSASSNATCITCEGNTVPIALYECVITEKGNAEWTGYSSLNCSESFEDKSTEDKAQFLAVTTSSTSETTSGDVETAVEGLGEISSSDNLNQSTADDVVTTVNNLLLVENEDAKDSVKQSSNSLLGTIDNIAANVALENNGGYNSYVEVQSSIALAVVENDENSGSRRRRAIGDTYYYGTNNFLEESNLNLALISLSLTQNEPSGSYMKSSADDGRTSFKMYLMSDTFLVGETNIVVAEVVFSVQGSTEFTLNFQTTGQLNISPDGLYVGDATRRLDCALWNRTESAWKDGGCRDYSAAGTFSSCVCSKQGEYIMRTVTVERPADNDGLSAGAIVGIVLGSICGAILVFGVIYYISKKRKQNKGKDYLKDDVQMANVNKEVEEPSLNEATNEAYTEDASEKSSLNEKTNDDSKEEEKEGMQF